MKLGLMRGDTVPASELRELGFEAVQMFFGGGADGDGEDPSPEAVDETLAAGNTVLAAMTLHVDLVGPKGRIDADVDRAARCVHKTAALAGRFGDNPRPILVWHPSGYPDEGGDDRAIFAGLVSSLKTLCGEAETAGVDIAVELTRAGSVGSAETFLRLQDHVGSPALKVCLDAANFCPDRTPLERTVRMLGPDTIIAHGKDACFADNGEVADYGPTGSGRLDYATYMRALGQYCSAAYFVLEYYRSREDLLKARDIVLAGMK
ncbi:MAG: sugar phosphate isomerase/epimerase [Gemmatimonadetes bacterium]|jgi:sugar phosphate isomerase/epimerase|nr:sugar phosphate isomerase/epimerase [Gemmatimonadota bacterium]MBT6146446.1 sugar phosphate isomerase/epimerase [Gemmatimonadota bacterium]MBT7859543.1 sugar phosphate isomerase/epimerase [Gemmatimonadota bacterium]